ncbi:MAG TPA: LysM peptidoglycan-binding domain-containing protein [Symbiobacteriaceae bacterium]|nr:LysM peptidoglycan-binding domain-containing protein [Symbiobacteriaceae bacterium]
MQTKTNKNRGLMGLTALAMLAMLVGLGWTVFQQKDTAKAPTTEQTVPAGTTDAGGATDTSPVVAGQTPIPATYTIAEGDTLSSIAQHFYGDSTYYWAIERANELVGTRDKLLVGKELKLPSMAEVASNN